MTFGINTLWFEVAVMAGISSLGQSFFARFAVQTPSWKRVLKLVLFTALACTVSVTLGRARFFVLLGVLAVAVTLVHALYLPLHGVNGWTGEPKAKYYALRGPKIEDL